MMYGSNIIMLYTLNLNNTICQLYFNKTGRKKKIISVSEDVENLEPSYTAGVNIK